MTEFFFQAFYWLEYLEQIKLSCWSLEFLFQVDSPPLPLPPLPDNERTEVLTAPQEKE